MQNFQTFCIATTSNVDLQIILLWYTKRTQVVDIESIYLKIRRGMKKFKHVCTVFPYGAIVYDLEI